MKYEGAISVSFGILITYNVFKETMPFTTAMFVIMAVVGGIFVGFDVFKITEEEPEETIQTVLPIKEAGL